jgi:Tol biopolymer transport system component
MRIMIRSLFLTTALLASGGMAQQPSQQNLDLQAAIRTESIDGDLNLAIRQFQTITSKYKQDRAVVALALVHMADCYKKLGNSESHKLYERVLHEYADQPAAVALADAGIGGEESTARAGDRPVWTGPAVDGFGGISPDGRYLTYVDWNDTGGLMLHDLKTGTDRKLTAGAYADGEALYSIISKDGKQVVYDWFLNDEKKHYELRISSLEGTGVLQSRRLFYDKDFQYLAPYDWSPDGKWIAVGGRREDHTSIMGILSVRDGSLKVLKTTGWFGPEKAFFSPDGRYLAYDLPASDGSKEQDIFVTAVDGSQDTAVLKYPSSNAAMGWSPHGDYLLFGSDRSGSESLWSVPIADGKANGEPSQVMSDIGSDWSLGQTRAGTLYVWRNGGPEYVEVAGIDLATGKLDPNAVGASRRFIVSNGRPAWSPDGQYVAYQSCTRLGGGPCTLYIHSLKTGEDRELHPKLAYLWTPYPSLDHKSIVALGTDLGGRRGIYRIDAETGGVSFVAAAKTHPWWSSDGKSIYYVPDSASSDLDHGVLVVVKRELATGEEQQVFRSTPDESLRGVNVLISPSMSPDGKYIAMMKNSRDGSQALLLVRLSDGTIHELLRVHSPEMMYGGPNNEPCWTPDGRALLIREGVTNDADKSRLLLVPIDGTEPRELETDTEKWPFGPGMYSLSPDGQHIAFVAVAGKPGMEIWALNSFLSKLGGGN